MTIACADGSNYAMNMVFFLFILNFMAIVMYERRANTCTVWAFVVTPQRVVDLDRLN